jgi:hypothetical protein
MGNIKKLEFYLDFDKWTVNDLNDFNKGYDDIAIMYTVTSFELYRKMVKKYPHIEITPINTREINTNCCCPAYGIATHVIKNPESKKFMVISWCDKAYYIGKGNLEKSHPLYERYKDSWGWDLDNCVNIFQPEGVHYDDLKYKKLIPHDCYDNEGYRKDCVEFEYTPCTITTHFKSGHDQIEISYKNEDRIVPEKLFFNGRGTPFRNYLITDNRFETNPSERLSGEDFIKKLSKYSIIMDVNSVAEISARTIDGMGLGCAVIRPELVIEYHNKLIPNYHYAKVECDDLSDFKKLSDAYIDKFEELKNNPKLVEFYSQNGRKWYEENCTLDSYVRIYLDELIDLEKLK